MPKNSVVGKIIDQVGGLFADFNKTKKDDPQQQEGLLSDLESEFSLEISDSELIGLKKQWQEASVTYDGEISKKTKKNVDYWLGKQHGYADIDKGIIDNVIFQSLETFLPIAARQVPSPVVTADNTEDGIKLSEDIQKMLAHIADVQALKVKIKQVLRNWALYYVGVVQICWDFIENDICIQVVRPADLILDPNASFDVNEYQGTYVGRHRSSDASTLVKRFPKMKEIITEAVSGRMATKIGYIEWWTNEYVFWTMKDLVLGKFKNPHWNYTSKEMRTDEFGRQIEEEVKGKNHFKQPKIPFIFLSVFNIGLHPHDDTCLVEQVLSLQDTVNKRARQIDKNADEMNNGWVVNSQFDKESANALATSLKKGGVIRAPTIDISQSVHRFPGVPLPNFIPEDLSDKRSEIQNVMGVRGSMAQGLLSERTVRGKIEIKGQDVDRISLVTDFLEQFSDSVFNWCLQMMFVYYTDVHTASIIGSDKAVELVKIRNSDLNREFTVSVKEGSMIPQDPLTRRNEAVDLWAEKAIDPITLAERLDIPNPQDYAKRLFLWQNNPAALFPDLASPMAQPTPEAAPPPSGIPQQAPDQNQLMQLNPQV